MNHKIQETGEIGKWFEGLQAWWNKKSSLLGSFLSQIKAKSGTFFKEEEYSKERKIWKIGHQTFYISMNISF